MVANFWPFERSKSVIEIEKRNNTILSGKIDVLKNIKHECFCDCCEYDEVF